MEYWFAIILALIAIAAISILLYFEVMGDEAALIKKKHRRGKYVNDQTAVICQTIKDTIDSRKAYSLFVEYVFTNHKQFLEFVKNSLIDISKTYNDGNIEGLDNTIADIKEMKVELKDQRLAQVDCMNTIDKSVCIEFIYWIHLSNNCRFGIDASLRRMGEISRVYLLNNDIGTFPEVYTVQLESLLSDICNICDSAHSLIGTDNIEEMRDLRKNIEVILSESYTNTQRLYELIHDGRSEFEEEKLIALKYALNASQELHGILYTLRRFMLANICLTLSLK